MFIILYLTYPSLHPTSLPTPPHPTPPSPHLLLMKSIIKYCSETKDPLVPSVWGKLDDRENHYKEKGGKCIML